MTMAFCPNSMREARKILNIVDQYGESLPDIKARGR
jgi:hypothetical protein